VADVFVLPEWLEAVRGKQLFYPAAGSDWTEPLHLFADHVGEFWFADTEYRPGLQMSPVFADGSEFRLVSRDRSGSPDAIKERRRAANDREYWFVNPGNLREVYERSTDGRRIVVNRRRGFGQYALSLEFAERTIGVFMHRGDSPGESGSNVYFLANRRRDHEPCSNLFDKLAAKLADRAIVLSDGSNTRLKQLKKFHNSSTSSIEAFEASKGFPFFFGSFRWECIGYVQPRNGPTLAWGLVRLCANDKGGGA
jgi:hypothetical protein